MSQQDKDHWARYTQAYDRVLCQYTRYKELIGLCVQLLSDRLRILDIGCGPGHLIQNLLKQNPARFVAGADINQLALAQVREKIHGMHMTAQLVLADGGQLPFGNNQFDAITSILVLWAVEDPEAYLVEHLRVLDKGGILVLAGPGSETKTNYRDHLRSVHDDLTQQGILPDLQDLWDAFLSYTDSNVSHGEHWFTESETFELLEKVGFSIIQSQPNPVYMGEGQVIVARR